MQRNTVRLLPRTVTYPECIDRQSWHAWVAIFAYCIHIVTLEHVALTQTLMHTPTHPHAHARTHTHTRTHTHACTHTHTHHTPTHPHTHTHTLGNLEKKNGKKEQREKAMERAMESFVKYQKEVEERFKMKKKGGRRNVN